MYRSETYLIMELSESQLDFHLFYSSKGGFFDTDQLNESIRVDVERFREKANETLKSFQNFSGLKKPAPNINFDFVNNLRMNASVGRDKAGNYFMGVNIGTVLVLYDVFFRMLAHKDILTRVGDASVEKITFPTLPDYFVDGHQIPSLTNFKAVRLVVPQDAERLFYARHLANLALSFVVMHELNHIANGHVEFISTNEKRFMLEEQLPRRFDFHKAVLRQTLEMDADLLGVTKTLGTEIRRYTKERPVSESTAHLYGDFNEIIFNWALAVQTMLRLMVQNRFYTKNGAQLMEHPFPRIRMTMILALIPGYLDKYFPDLRKQFSVEVLTGIIETVEDAFKKITGRNVNKEDLMGMAEAGPYIKLLNQTWKKIHSELSRHSFVRLVEPIDE